MDLDKASVLINDDERHSRCHYFVESSAAKRVFSCILARSVCVHDLVRRALYCVEGKIKLRYGLNSDACARAWIVDYHCEDVVY